MWLNYLDAQIGQNWSGDSVGWEWATLKVPKRSCHGFQEDYFNWRKERLQEREQVKGKECQFKFNLF